MSKMPRNFLLRMGQMMAERQRNMTIVERTARWYRMERVEEQTIPHLEERLDKLNEKINSINAVVNLNPRYFIQRINELEERLNKYTASRKKKNDSLIL
ncbi:hypothetical protein LCGC14_1368220 [marine sediment metagenome]|uniref:Uncharacterized protein n=1 Tax=marine sediment metagenome TaxID=412755 RepID=A0A0F9KS27_9ZZZZ